jgi:hypothetical protein
MSPAVQRVVAALEQCGCEPHHENGKLRARCPVHGGDSRRSLKIDEGDDGKALLYCFKGCSYESIVGAAGIDKGDTFVEPGPGRTPRSRAKAAKTPKIRTPYPEIPSTYEGARRVASYPTTLGDGTGQAVCVRYQHPGSEKKQIVPFEADAAGGYWLGLGGKKLDVYVPGGMPLIADRGAFTVILNEGQKAADRCAEYVSTLGDEANSYLAVGTHGAGSFHGPDGLRLVRQLEGFAEIVVVVDRDEDGGEWAENFRHHAETRLQNIRFVQSKVTAPKADLFDHLEGGHSIDDLVPLAKTAGKAETPARVWAAVSVAEMIRSETKPIDFLVGGVAAREDVTILSGPPKTTKTWTVLCLEIEAALGRSVFGRYAVPGPLRVLHVDEEMGRGKIARRLQRLARGLKLTPEEIDALDVNLLVYPQQGFEVSSDEGLGELRRVVEAHRPDLVVFDSFAAFTSDAEEKDNSARRRFYNRVLAPLKTDYSLGIIVLGHPPLPAKDQVPDAQKRLRGGGDILGSCDRSLYIAKESEEPNAFGKVVTSALGEYRAREAGGLEGPHSLTLEDVGSDATTCVSAGGGTGVLTKALGKANSCAREILHVLRQQPDDEMYQPTLKHHLSEQGYSADTIKVALASLYDQKAISRLGARPPNSGKWIKAVLEDEE